MENNDDKLLSEYLSDDKSDKFRKNLKKFINKVLISLVLLIGSLIFIKISPENKDNFKKVVFNDTFKFNKFNNFYEKYFGSFNIKKEVPVISKKIDYTNGEKYLNGIKLNLEDNIVNSISTGIVVFKGNKDITNQLPASAFVWKRTSSDSAADATWNSNHRSMKTVIITSTDIIDTVGIFDCDVEFDETSF